MSGWPRASSCYGRTSRRRSASASCGAPSPASAIQWLLNLEIERYTLATGETALTGFSRLWRPAGLAFVVAVAFANAWPGWATSSATLLTFLIGGDSAVIAALMLVTAGAILTLAPVVYTALERLIVIKVAAIGILAGLALWLVIEPASWPALAAEAVSGAGRLPQGLSLPIALGAIAFAGAGGGQNLCQSNWIRDKGFGMGRYVAAARQPDHRPRGAGRRRPGLRLRRR